MWLACKESHQKTCFFDFLDEHITSCRQEASKADILSPTLSDPTLSDGSPYPPSPGISPSPQSPVKPADLDKYKTDPCKSAKGRKINAFHRRMSLRTISYKRRVSESRLPMNALQISWICQNLVENRIGQSVYKTLTKLLGIDPLNSTTYMLYDMKNDSNTTTDVTARVRIHRDSITIERLSIYEISQDEQDFTVLVHVKTTSRYFTESEEEELRIEMMFAHDDRKQKKKKKKQQCDWFDSAKLKSDVTLTLHSERSSVPKLALLKTHEDALGMRCLSPKLRMGAVMEKHHSL